MGDVGKCSLEVGLGQSCIEHDLQRVRAGEKRNIRRNPSSSSSRA